MGGCSAINCSNHSRKGFQMARLPKNEERRKKWIINMRRENWQPGPSAQICISHFEESQFETKHEDGHKKLKSDAVPTLFDVPNKPFTLDLKRQKGIGCPKPDTILDRIAKEKENIEDTPDSLEARLKYLEEENRKLQSVMQKKEEENKNLQLVIQKKDKQLSSFLSNEQIEALDVNKKYRWTNESIVKGLKFRFALGKHGLNYLRSTGYPLPAYSTLNRRIQNVEFDFGVMQTLFLLLKTKIQAMTPEDRNCSLLIDEMQIAPYQDFDPSKKRFIGNITLGEADVAKNYLVCMIKGLKSHWKQVVAHELTGASTSGLNMKRFISDVISAAHFIGLKVRASVSDMGSSNKAMWNSLGVCVSKDKRQTLYAVSNYDIIHCVADVPHLLKNMRNAFLSRMIVLPSNICQDNDLPTCNVSSGYIKQLWISELKCPSSLRSLQHLNKKHLFPSHFQSMNVATAVQLFSIKTAAALEKAVALKQINKSALSTAWWIRMVCEWFTIMTARQRKCSITVRNKNDKYQFLNAFIEIMQHIKLGNGWKPLQTGIILSTLSIINLAEDLFSDGLKFFLPGRMTQDALENVFSQVRRKGGSKPTALQAKRALRLVCISQFISDIKNSNYASDSDFYLFDKDVLNTYSFLSTTESDRHESASVLMDQPSTSTQNHSLPVDPPCTSTQNHVLTTPVQENDIYFIAGATLNYLCKSKGICENCKNAIETAEDPVNPMVPSHRALFTVYCDKGGLKKTKSGMYRICREAERVFQMCKTNLLSEELSINEYISFINKIKNNCQDIILPECCNVKEKAIDHYILVRCNGLKNHLVNKKVFEISYASASFNKKQKIQ